MYQDDCEFWFFFVSCRPRCIIVYTAGQLLIAIQVFCSLLCLRQMYFDSKRFMCRESRTHSYSLLPFSTKSGSMLMKLNTALLGQVCELYVREQVPCLLVCQNCLFSIKV